MRILFFIMLLFTSLPALAVEPNEMVADPALEARAREISRNLRCVVCQGQDIDSSGAAIASDLRRIVRERVSAGDGDAQVYDYLRARYGDYVLMRPPVEEKTALLWAAPLLVLCAGAGMVFVLIRRRG